MLDTHSPLSSLHDSVCIWSTLERQLVMLQGHWKTPSMVTQYTQQKERLTTESVATLIRDSWKARRQADSVQGIDVSESSEQDGDIEVDGHYFEDDGSKDNGSEDFCCDIASAYQSQIDG